MPEFADGLLYCALYLAMGTGVAEVGDRTMRADGDLPWTRLEYGFVVLAYPVIALNLFKDWINERL